MLTYDDISRVVEGVAKPALGGTNVVRVFAGPGTDADGNDIVAITIVVAPGAIDRIDDDALVNTLVATNKRLRRSGEERQSIVFYATEEELMASGDSES